LTSPTPIEFDLGTFEGYNFWSQSPVEGTLTAADVIGWDHDENGEADFWPSGDRPEVVLLFRPRNGVTATELQHLNRLLTELGGDSAAEFLKIHFAINIRSADLTNLSAEDLDEDSLHIFYGSNFTDQRREAAFELFELFYPEPVRFQFVTRVHTHRIGGVLFP